MTHTFAQFTIPRSTRLNLASTYVFLKFKRLDWQIENCAKIKTEAKMWHAVGSKESQENIREKIGLYKPDIIKF